MGKDDWVMKRKEWLQIYTICSMFLGALIGMLVIATYVYETYGLNVFV